ncbi:FAD-dependent oxidoreductase [Streptomyces sp. NPDC058548]|uniref:FAD-dependent oxidoreductase n=1 Tax=unclassified Streptomyces TaxID=2593676 RepID=UPI00364EFC21
MSGADFDAVVIGAGNAGLTAAATLQRAGARTLLVERHSVPGGCATSFRRGRVPLPGPPGRGDLRLRPGRHRELAVPRQRTPPARAGPPPRRILVRHGRLPAHPRSGRARGPAPAAVQGRLKRPGRQL